MNKVGFVLLAWILAGAGLAGAPAAPGVALRGCLAQEGPLDAAATAGLPAIRRLVKVLAEDGAYRCAMEVEGFALRDVLDRIGVQKKVDDGFDRPLDVFVTVTGHTGQRALLSYSEIFLAGDGGPLLVQRARLILPHKHDPLEPGGPDPTVLLDLEARSGLDLASCAACHAGGKLPALSLPKGWMLVVPQDGFRPRFVEEVAEIAVRQVGTPVKPDKAAAHTGFVGEPALVRPDGTRQPLTRKAFARSRRTAWKDATFGMGMGYHGIRTWEGADLGALLRPLLPRGADPRLAWVVVTALDGYRVLYSGAEVFTAPEGRGVMLADRINGAPLGTGSGRYHAVPRADFFVDRDVFLVKEIRIGLAQGAF